ncbi:MAG: oligopeptide transporter, OPT family [Verrucomicrobiota bacterium]|nr:oligopeptide transporter, OPT family [Verrucomicrobiota bacterium]
MPDIVGAKPTNPFLASFTPFIPASTRIAEFTPVPLIVGTLLGMLFGASSLYLVLKVGLTVSASIPVAVLSITIFRLFAKLRIRRDATILENNIVQTAGSAGESIAFGLGVTMPAIMILGFDLEIMRVMLVAILGGLLGILMMIPLRRALIVDQHGLLKYPEGTACAEVLKVAAAKDPTGELSPEARRAIEQDETSGGGKIIFSGFGIGLLYQTAMGAFKAWKDVPEKVFGAPLKSGSIAAEISPALLGVGYIIGPRIASIMCAGGVLAYLVLIPAIKFFGEKSGVIIPPGTTPIGEMGPNDIRGAYVLYIGAGAVAAGGIISLFRSLPTIWHGLRGGLADIRGGRGTSESVPRTDQDLPMKFVLCGVLALIAMIMAVPQLNLQWNILGAILIVAFGFLFVTVSSRLTGEIGSSSNPISGMTVATLLLTCLVFLFLGWTTPNYFVTALSIGGIVCIASSNGGTTSQDLKTGFLVGATPRLQQIAILIGAFASAIVLGPILLTLNNSSTVYVPAVTFAPVPQDVARTDLGAAAAALPPFTEGVKPEPRDFRLLRSDAADQAQEIAGLGAGEYLVGEDARIAYKVERHFASDLQADPAQLGKAEKLKGVQGAGDQNSYRVWQRADPAGGPAQKFLVNEQGIATYLVDPGINGTQRFRPDGSAVTKFDAPKATLMSYIIKGILSRELPWALVLLGVFIAIVLEMSGIPSLAFAVGVYLPLSSSSPIFIGGMVRWMVDRYLRREKFRGKNLTPEELVAEGDKSSGVLLASGYIAGGALAGIIIAIMQGMPALAGFSRAVEDWAAASNPFYHGPNADLLAMIPFMLLTILLYLVGRDALLAHRKAPARTR